MSKQQFVKLNQLSEAAENIFNIANGGKKMVFIGEIGAGKTTLIQELCRQLGVEGTVTSPTFSLVNEYATKDGECIYHLDLYRLKDEQEALDIGIEDYLYSGHYCFIEWPEIIENQLTEDVIRIKLSVIDDSTRKMIFL